MKWHERQTTCAHLVDSARVQVARGATLLEPRILQGTYSDLLPVMGYAPRAHSFASKVYKLDSACTMCRGVLKVQPI
jgi:hypothetical protein